jgi:hypothetical protein
VPNPFRKSAPYVLAAALVAGGPARAAETRDVYLQIVDATASYSGHILMSNGKVSVEGDMAHRPGATRTHLGRTVVIHNHRRDEWLQFVPNQNQYVRISAKGQALAVYLPPGLKRRDLRAETVGHEVVDGESTNKIKLSFPTGVLMLWQTPDGIVVKMEGTATVYKRQQTVTMKLTKLKRGAQDPALFVPPPGSTLLNAPLPKKAAPKPAGKPAPQKK